MASENSWVAHKSWPPTAEDYKNYHENFLTPLEVKRFKNAADIALNDFASKAVNSEQTRLLAESLRAYQENSAAHHQAFRRNGVKEAIWGAFWWTMILIVFSFIIAFANIDPLEYYRKANNLFHQESPIK